MADVVCAQAMQVLNAIFTTPLIFNDGHEILQRLQAGDEVADIAEELGRKFGQPGQAEQVRALANSWPPLHVEAIGSMVQWALAKLDTDDRVTIRWKGDAEHSETVTKFELRDHTLLIEFAHPPAGIQPARVGSP